MLYLHLSFIMYSYLFDHDESGWTVELCVYEGGCVCLLHLARCTGFIPGRWLLVGGGGGAGCVRDGRGHFYLHPPATA